jgi:hypothetical protein
MAAEKLHPASFSQRGTQRSAMVSSCATSETGTFLLT